VQRPVSGVPGLRSCLPPGGVAEGQVSGQHDRVSSCAGCLPCPAVEGPRPGGHHDEPWGRVIGSVSEVFEGAVDVCIAAVVLGQGGRGGSSEPVRFLG
jgi:hypothetical protein